MNPDDLMAGGGKGTTGSRGPTTPPRRTLIQTQLNRIVNPSSLCFETFTRWLLRFRDRAAYPSLDLQERLTELDQEIPLARARADLLTDAEEWSRATDREDRLRGQRLAIRETLRLRGPDDGTNSSAYCPDPVEIYNLHPEFDRDPFRD